MTAAVTYTYLVWAELLFALVTFLILFFVTAPYGRFVRKGWGPSIPAYLGWIIMEIPAVIVPAYFFIRFGAYEQGVLISFFLIWQLHYFHRAFIYPFQKSGGQKPFPILLVFMAILFNLMNGYINGYEVFVRNDYLADWWLQWPYWCGLLLFAVGYFVNKQSDTILKNLRKPGEDTYKIPKGGGFRWVSNPHYLGEILEWCGWAILTWSVSGWVFVAYTFANLAPRALAHHRWYQSEFEAYPKNRKAIIPYIW